MKAIQNRNIVPATISIPGSKSLSHRMLICASLANGKSTLKNLLNSEDIEHTMMALCAMGAKISKPVSQIKEGEVIEVNGFGGMPTPHDEPIFLGNSGTSMRLLAGIAALGRSSYTLTGDERMQERPMGDLLEALKMAGVAADTRDGDGTPPITITGNEKAQGGEITLDCSQSSQYLSAMLMMGPFLPRGLTIHLPGKAVSAPYVDLTMDVMKQFGVHAERISDTVYHVAGSQVYRAGRYVIEPDLSNASYFWAAGAVTGKRITVADVNQKSLQGDKRLLDIFEQMGCRVEHFDHGIGVCSDGGGASLAAVEVDMSDIPDVVPTLAVVASFAKGTTKVVNIAHLREKECDRISAVVSQLKKMNVEADQGEDWLSVTGGDGHKGAVVETFNDHRIAMAFSIAGLMVEGVQIENEGCVSKSFPTFWDKFDALRGV